VIQNKNSKIVESTQNIACSSKENSCSGKDHSTEMNGTKLFYCFIVLAQTYHQFVKNKRASL
jgi:hypothetical protein